MFPERTPEVFNFTDYFAPEWGLEAVKESVVAWADADGRGCNTNVRALVAEQKLFYSSRFVRVILAQGPC